MNPMCASDQEVEHSPAEVSARDVEWEKLVYTCSYLTPLEILQLRMVGYILVLNRMSRLMHYLMAINALAYVLLLVFIFTVRSFELSLIAVLGVGFLSGATFIIWVVKDILPRRKK